MRESAGGTRICAITVAVSRAASASGGTGTAPGGEAAGRQPAADVRTARASGMVHGMRRGMGLLEGIGRTRGEKIPGPPLAVLASRVPHPSLLTPDPLTTSRGSPQAAVLASFLGWTLDAFDFFLVVFTLTAIGKEFAVSDATMAATLSTPLAFRPVGAFIFGLMADRYGRRLPLMLSLVFFSLMEVLSGLAARHHPLPIFPALFGLSMRRGRLARDGESAPRPPGALLGLPPGGLRLRLPPRRDRVLLRLPALGLAPALLHRRAPGAAGHLRPLAGERVRGVAQDPAPRLGLAGTGDRLPLEALPLPHGADDDDELRLARDPGHVSHVPATGLGLHAGPARRAHRVLDGRRDHRRALCRPPLGPVRAAPGDRRRAGGGDPRDPALGLRAFAPAAGDRGVPDAVHGAGGVGRHSGAHHGAGARCGARS